VIFVITDDEKKVSEALAKIQTFGESGKTYYGPFYRQQTGDIWSTILRGNNTVMVLGYPYAIAHWVSFCVYVGLKEHESVQVGAIKVDHSFYTNGGFNPEGVLQNIVRYVVVNKISKIAITTLPLGKSHRPISAEKAQKSQVASPSKVKEKKKKEVQPEKKAGGLDRKPGESNELLEKRENVWFSQKMSVLLKDDISYRGFTAPFPNNMGYEFFRSLSNKRIRRMAGAWVLAKSISLGKRKERFAEANVLLKHLLISREKNGEGVRSLAPISPSELKLDIEVAFIMGAVKPSESQKKKSFDSLTGDSTRVEAHAAVEARKRKEAGQTGGANRYGDSSDKDVLLSKRALKKLKKQANGDPNAASKVDDKTKVSATVKANGDINVQASGKGANGALKEALKSAENVVEAQNGEKAKKKKKTKKVLQDASRAMVDGRTKNAMKKADKAKHPVSKIVDAFTDALDISF